MPETPEQMYARAANALSMPPVEDWKTFPFEGDLRPRALQPPVEREEPRHGADGVDCRRCTAPDDEFLWTNERWRLHALDGPTGLPVNVILIPRKHFAELGDLPDAAIWDDILPPLPEDVWRANLAAVAAALEE